MNRSVGAIITLTWLLCMAALIQRDVLPFWRAQDPPEGVIPPGDFQVAILDESGGRVGTTWVRTTRLSTYTTVYSTTRLSLGALSRMLPIAGEMFLDTELTYGEDETLNEFTFRLDTAPLGVRVEGVRYGEEYACTARIGSVVRTMSFDGELSKYLGNSLRPFTHLQGLAEGQTWRLRLIDPLALIQGESLEFTMQLVTVTRRETIQHQGEAVTCFRIETDGATAWADDSGRVLKQEVHIPFLGTWILLDEPFDAQAQKHARQAIQTMRVGRAAFNVRSGKRTTDETLRDNGREK